MLRTTVLKGTRFHSIDKRHVSVLLLYYMQAVSSGCNPCESIASYVFSRWLIQLSLFFLKGYHKDEPKTLKVPLKTTWAMVIPPDLRTCSPCIKYQRRGNMIFGWTGTSFCVSIGERTRYDSPVLLNRIPSHLSSCWNLFPLCTVAASCAAKSFMYSSWKTLPLACHPPPAHLSPPYQTCSWPQICDATPLAPRSFAGGQTGKGVGRHSLLPGKSIFFDYLLNGSDPQRRHCFSKGLFHQHFHGRLFGFNGWLDFLGFVWACSRSQGRSSC